jgi:hypothetical protein
MHSVLDLAKDAELEGVALGELQQEVGQAPQEIDAGNRLAREVDNSA